MSNKLVLLIAFLFTFTVNTVLAQRSLDSKTEITDLYAFRSPDDDQTITIIANVAPMQTPKIGTYNNSFDENIRYEIHIENDGTSGDDLTYRFTFNKVNQDPTTIFAIRLGQENNKITYSLEKSINGGPFSTIVSNGTVPSQNIGNRSISDPTVGLGAANYNALINASIQNANGGGGELVFCGPADDPFFTNIGGFNDIANGSPSGTVVMGNASKNINTIALKIPIATLQKNGQPVANAVNILDSDYIIGVWASTSRPSISTLNNNGTETFSGSYVQVSRVGMPLTDDMIIPIGEFNRWNSLTPYNEDPAMEAYFCNPEMGLYMDNSLFGGAIPALAALRIQRNSLQSFDFGNTNDGLWPVRASNGGPGTAIDTNLFGNYLLRQGNPRSLDLLPLYHTGVPNLSPYLLATGKNGNPLAVGKPFINNFLPTFGDMLRLNMAVPVTVRGSADFSSLGLVNAMLLGLTSAPYNTNANLEFIPNMDGFPNGRRLEDDVMRISLQLQSGILLASMGFWYDDFSSGNPITQDFIDVTSFTTGIEQNDTTFKAVFPYVQVPWSGTTPDTRLVTTNITVTVFDTISTTINDTNFVSVTDTLIINLVLTGLTAPNNINTLKVFPNPSSDRITIETGNFGLMTGYNITINNSINQSVFTTAVNQASYNVDITTWSVGIYFVNIKDNLGNTIDVKKIVIQ